MATTLSEKMIARANLDGLPEDHKLRELAEEFNKASNLYYSEPQC